VISRHQHTVPGVEELLGGHLQFIKGARQPSMLDRIASKPYDGRSSDGFITTLGSKIASASARSPTP
jgi:hypothetical protein